MAPGLTDTAARIAARRGGARRRTRTGARSREATHRPDPVPGAGHVPDPDGAGWWDDSLTPSQVATRLEGLASCIDAMEAGGAPADWVVSERLVLAGLCQRARRERATAEMSPRDREILALEPKCTQREIARRIGCSKTTVGRVVQRHREGRSNTR